MQEVVWSGHWFDTQESGKIEFPDIGGFYATTVKTKSNDLIYFYIYSKDGIRLGQLDMLGHLDYQTGSDSSRWYEANNNFKHNLKNAVRFVFLQNQKPIETKKQLAERTVVSGGKVAKHLKFDDIDGWSAVLLEEESHYSWRIFNKSGEEIGELKYDGELNYEDDKIGAWRTADRTFSYDERGVKTATRYIYLMTQKPLNEENPQHKTEYVFPEIDGWKVKVKGIGRVDFTNGEYVIDTWYIIHNKENQPVGQITKFANGKVGELHYLPNTGTAWEGAGRSFDTDEKGLKQATRFVWLMRQKPLKKKKQLAEKDDISDATRHILQNEIVRFKDVKGYYAKGMLDKKTYESNKDKNTLVYALLYNNKDEQVGTLATGGKLFVAKTPRDIQYEVDMKFPSNIKGVKNALRYIFLQYQKPIQK